MLRWFKIKAGKISICPKVWFNKDITFNESCK